MLIVVDWFEDINSFLANSSPVTESLETSGKKTLKLLYQVMRATVGIKKLLSHHGKAMCTGLVRRSSMVFSAALVRIYLTTKSEAFQLWEFFLMSACMFCS